MQAGFRFFIFLAIFFTALALNIAYAAEDSSILIKKLESKIKQLNLKDQLAFGDTAINEPALKIEKIQLEIKNITDERLSDIKKLQKEIKKLNLISDEASSINKVEQEIKKLHEEESKEKVENKETKETAPISLEEEIEREIAAIDEPDIEITLQQALDIAIENNHHIKSASATLPITEAKLIIAKYRPNPQIGSFNEIVKGGSLHPAQIGTQIETGRKRHWRVEASKEAISKTELEIRKTIWEVHNQVHSAYAALSVGLELFKLAKQRTEFYRRLAEVAETRYETGDISKLELTRAQMEYMKVENLYGEFEARLKKAKIEFNHILGRDPSLELVLEGPQELLPKIELHDHPELKKIIDDALSQRLEIAILEKEFGIKRAQLSKAMWERLPNLYIEGGPTKPSVGDNIWGPYFGASLEVPLFNRKQGEIKEVKAQIDYLEKEKDRIEHDIKIEVANAFHDLEVREEQVHRFKKDLLNLSEALVEMTILGYEKGKLSLTDVLNAEQQDRQVNKKYLESLLNYRIALANLEYAVGVPLSGFGEEL